MRAIGGDENKLGFTLEQRKSTRHGPRVITDCDFVDDICLMSSDLKSAQNLRNRVEDACSDIGLNVDEKKTEFMTFNSVCKDTLTTSCGTVLSQVPDFKYLGSYISSSAKDISVRISLAWTAFFKLEKIWKSKLERSKKYKVFAACVESVLFCGSETWALTKKLKNRLHGTHYKP